MIHTNSLEAYRDIEATGAKQNRADAILACYQGGRAYTDREILQVLFPFSDNLNLTRPRISELIDGGELEECGTKVDRVSGKNVRLVRLKNREPQTSMF